MMCPCCFWFYVLWVAACRRSVEPAVCRTQDLDATTVPLRRAPASDALPALPAGDGEPRSAKRKLWKPPGMERPVPPSPPSAAAGASRLWQQPTAPRLQHVPAVQLHTDTVAAEPAVEGGQQHHAADGGGRQPLATRLDGHRRSGSVSGKSSDIDEEGKGLGPRERESGKHLAA